MSGEPQDVAAVLVAHGRLAAARADEARERHVLAGGALDTALLETGLVEEQDLVEALAAATGLKAVGASELAAAPPAALHLLPKRVAEKHRIVPVALQGRRLTVAVAGAPDLALLDEVGFMLSVYLRPVVTTEVRLAAALAAHYDVPVPPRMRAILGMLDGASGRTRLMPGDVVPEDVTPLQEPVFALAGGDGEPERLDLRTTSEQELWRAREARAPAAQAAAAVNAALADDVVAHDAWSVARGEIAAVPVTSAAIAVAPAPAHAEAELLSGGVDEVQRLVAQQRVLARIEEEDAAVRAREEARRTQRVLWTVDDAIAELALATERDEMLDVVLRFAYRRLGTAAIFVLHRAELCGWDVIDPFMSRRDFERLAVPIAGEHVLAQVVAMKSPFLGPLKDGDPLLRLFGKRPRAVILVPILVGDRIAGVVYGDCGVRSIAPASMAELHMVVPRLGKALGNLIVRKKRRAAGETGPLPARPAVQLRAITMTPVVVAEEDPIEVGDDDLEVVEGAVASDDALDGLDGGGLDDVLHAAVAEATAKALAPRPQRSIVYAEDVAPEEDVAVDDSVVMAIDGAAAYRARETESFEADGFENVVSNIRVLDGAAGFDDEATVPPIHEPTGFTGAMPAPSPGARARESLLLATWNEWIAHDDPEADELVAALRRPPEQQKLAVATIVAQGVRAMPALARYFPGVVDKHPFGDMDARPEPARFSDCLLCMAKLGADLAAPILLAELEHEDRLHRYVATWALAALRVPAALPRLAARVFDTELRIASTALEVLGGYRDEPGFPAVLEEVRGLCRRGDAFQRKRAILAVCELRDKEGLLPLVDLLGTRPKDVAEEARRALIEITKQDFGTSERKWRAWIDDNARAPRVRWLIDALAHKDAAIRQSAQAELNRLTGQFFGYRADAPRGEREAGIQAWNAWWAEQQAAKWP